MFVNTFSNYSINIGRVFRCEMPESQRYKKSSVDFYNIFTCFSASLRLT